MNEIESLSNRIEELEFELMSEKIVRSSTEQVCAETQVKLDQLNERVNRLERFVMMQSDFVRELQDKLKERN